MDDDVTELWLRRLAGQTLAEAEEQTLLRRLVLDPTLRSALLQDERFHGMLTQLGRSERDAEAFVEDSLARIRAERDSEPFVERVQERLHEEIRRPAAKARGSPWLRALAPLAAAATLLAAVGVWRWSRGTGEVMATVVAASGDYRISNIEYGSGKVGQEIRAGDRIETGTNGAVTLAWVGQATTVELFGHSSFSLVHSSLGRLALGRLTATVAEQAPGRVFALATPRARVEVVGTRFHLSDDGTRSRLDIEEGRVRLVGLADGRTERLDGPLSATVDTGIQVFESIYEDHFDGGTLSKFWQTADPPEQVWLNHPEQKSRLYLQASGQGAPEGLKPSVELVSQPIPLTQGILEIHVKGDVPRTTVGPGRDPAHSVSSYFVGLCDESGNPLVFNLHTGFESASKIGFSLDRGITMLLLPNADAVAFSGGALMHSGSFAQRPKKVRLRIEIANVPPGDVAKLTVDEVRVRRFLRLPSGYVSACDPTTAKLLRSAERDVGTPLRK